MNHQDEKLEKLKEAVTRALQNDNSRTPFTRLLVGSDWVPLLKEWTHVWGLEILPLPVGEDTVWLQSKGTYGYVTLLVDFNYARTLAVEAILRSGRVKAEMPSSYNRFGALSCRLLADEDTDDELRKAGGVSYSGWVDIIPGVARVEFSSEFVAFHIERSSPNEDVIHFLRDRYGMEVCTNAVEARLEKLKEELRQHQEYTDSLLELKTK